MSALTSSGAPGSSRAWMLLIFKADLPTVAYGQTIL